MTIDLPGSCKHDQDTEHEEHFSSRLRDLARILCLRLRLRLRQKKGSRELIAKVKGLIIWKLEDWLGPDCWIRLAVELKLPAIHHSKFSLA